MKTLQWVALAVIGWLAWERFRPPAAGSAAPPRRQWVLDISVGVTVLAIVAGAATGSRWLTLLGFGAAVFGLLWSLKHALRRLSRWLGGWRR